MYDPSTNRVILQFSNATTAKGGCDIGAEILGGVLQIQSSNRGASWTQFLNVQSQLRFPQVKSGGDDVNGDCLAPTSGAGLVMRPDKDGKFGGRIVSPATVGLGFCCTRDS